MKTIIIILCVISLLVFAEMLTNRFLRVESEFYINSIDRIVEELEDENYYEIDTELILIIRRWEKTQSLWNMIFDHQEIENIANLIYTSKSYVDTKTYDEATANLVALKSSILNTCKRYSIIWENIL